MINVCAKIIMRNPLYYTINKCLISKYLAFFKNYAHVKKLNGGICISGEIIFIQSEIQKVYFSSLLGTKTVAVADKSKHSA